MAFDTGTLLSMALGGLLGSQASGGSQQSGTATTSTAPWGPQQPYLLDLFNQAKAMSGNPGVSPAMQSALTGMQNAMNPALNTAAAGTIQNTIQGGNRNPYSGPNPYLEGIINRSLGDVSSRINSQFGGNNYGTTAHQETLARSLGDQSNAMRFQDYGMQAQLGEQGLNRQMNASFNAPQFNSAAMNNYGSLFNAANTMNNAQWQPLQNYGSMITGGFGSQMSQPMYTNPWSGALGGAIAGGSLYGSIFPNGGK